MEQSETKPTAGAVKRALAILECLDNARRGLNISEISRRLTIPKSSTHVIVRTLEHLGYVERETGGVHYSLGLRARVLGSGLGATVDLARAARPWMAQLAEAVRSSVHLALPDRDGGVFVQKIDVPGTDRFDTSVGRCVDLQCSASCKVIQAYAPATQPSRELTRVRSSGYACDGDAPDDEVRCIAVPVLARSGRFVAALSVHPLARRVSPDEIEHVVRRCSETAAIIGSANTTEEGRHS